MAKETQYTSLAYILTFPSATTTGKASPIVEFTRKTDGTFSAPAGLEHVGVHGFDPELYPLIDPLWYTLHLPRSVADTLDVSGTVIRKVQQYPSTQVICAVPHPFAHPYEAAVPAGAAVLHFYPKELEAELEKKSKAIKNLILAAPFDFLTSANLPVIWEKIHTFCWPEEKQYCSAKILLPRNAVSLNLLPLIFIERQFSGGVDMEEVPADKESALGRLALCQSAIVATATLEAEKKTKEEALGLIEQYAERAKANLDIPVAVMLPGQAPAYQKVTRGMGTATKEIALKAEDDVLLFVTAHRALAAHGAALVGRPISAEAFQLLRGLEDHWAAGPKPQTIWRMLRRIGDVVRKSFDRSDLAFMIHASSISVFSDFPLGLMSTSPKLAPLGIATPVAYRPLTPLTRTLQFELTSIGMTPLWERLKVLMVECIADSDPVGQASRVGWDLALKQLEGHPLVQVTRLEPTSAAEIKAALAKEDFDVLIISAHGHYDRKSNTAGIIIGKSLSVGLEFERVPGLVILSACSVSPRGIGSVNIADVLLRQGARAVLGTLVPVDVRHNATLMVRFLVYIREVMEGRFEDLTIDKIWHHVQTTNAINDVISSHPTLNQWAHTRKNGVAPVEEFMTTRSIGRLRRAFAYEDTIKVLREIATADGIEKKFDAWIAAGIIPESLFYVMIGNPDQVVVKNPFSELSPRSTSGEPQV